MQKKKLISIISPAFNEAKNIARMVNEVDSVISSLTGFYYEYIIVDDGSSDDTWGEITKIAKTNKNVRGIRFTRNFGQQIAITAGIDAAKGDALIYCDSDLQHPPSLFPKLVAEWKGGAKIVHTKRIDTEGISPFKNLMSKVFYLSANVLSDTQMEEGMADFKLLDKEVYSKLKSMKEKNRFLRGMVSWMGYPSAVVEYKARKRTAGRPWYNFARNLEFAKTGILSLSTRPLKYILYFGLFLIIASLISLVTIIAIILYERDLRFFSPTIVLVTFNTLLIGFVIACTGIVAIYISYLYKEIIKRPTYLISEKINFKK
ncbi:MAG: glycosyltransferase family 2 protein [Patescibacteria group bacterium]